MAIIEVDRLNGVPIPTTCDLRRRPASWGVASTYYKVQYVDGIGHVNGFEILDGDSRTDSVAWFECPVDAIEELRKRVANRSVRSGAIVIRSCDGAVMSKAMVPK